MANEKILTRLQSLFKEEQWGRFEPKDIGISRFKILDDLFNAIVSENMINEALDECRAHLKEHPDSITAIYLIGLMGYHKDSIEHSMLLKKLLEIFTSNSKWAVVERIAEKMLEYGENSHALRALATSLEKLGRNRDAIPVLENLLRIDRFDAEVARKLAYAHLEDDQEKGIYYMKLAIEGFIKNREYDEVNTLWNRLVAVSWEDILFFERIERLLVDAKQFALAGSLLKMLLNKYRDEENPTQSISLLKKILQYKPDDMQARKELIRLYGVKYADHSQFEQFMKLSKLSNFRAPVKLAIEDFEKNIVFDKGNYVFHNSWKLGKIVEIDNERLVIDFDNKDGHGMSIEMALQSLKPIVKDHLYVQQKEDPEGISKLFTGDFISFFEILIHSYGGAILMEDIRRELIPRYVEEKNWSKWWSKARTLIKKDAHFGVSEKKKDLFFIREKPITYVDELLENFSSTESFTSRLNTAMEFINNIETDEGASVAPYFIDYFLGEMKGPSVTRQILSFFILKDFSRYVDASKLKLDTIRARVVDIIKANQDLPLISMKIGSYDYKKDLVHLVEESREDWPVIVSEMLFESPVRIHKYIVNILIRGHAFRQINNFIDRVTTGAKQYPEVFIWVTRNILTRVWDYEWLDYSRERLVITYFRLLSELKKIETDGNRLKNMALDLLFASDDAVMKDIISDFPVVFIGRLYDIFTNLPYIEDSHRDRFLNLIRTRHTGFSPNQAQQAETWDVPAEKIVVTPEGFERKKADLEYMISTEMVNLSRELAEVVDASADQRENVEYNALLEKQQILKMAISKLDDEMKNIEILDMGNINTDVASIGTRISIESIESKEKRTYTLLGPWDADFEKEILSVRSPIARAMLGKKVGEEFSLRINDEVKKFQVLSIEKYR